MENEFDEDFDTFVDHVVDPGDIECLDTANASMSESTATIEVHTRKDTYDWEQEKRKNIQFYDDGTMTYLWRGHTLTVLGLLVGLLIYVSMYETVSDDTEFNAKRGMCACLFVFVLLGVTVTPDGPFVRPHPAFWRLMFVLSILYQLCIIFVLFQNARDARLLLKHIDPELGVELSEKSYGGNCLIYDPNDASDPFHNVIDKMDLFVPMHFFGWWFKTLVLRDWWLCTVISIMFEILEYTLEHQLPNFSECWWDHWILDALVCNGGGILLGLQTLKFFKVRTYYWRGLWSLPNYREKLKRIIAQFGPYSWIEFDWRPTSSLGRWMSVLGIAFLFLVAELNTFYLKFVLWVPAGHSLNIIRLMMMLFWGAVSLRETFQYLEDPVCKKFGRQSWVVLAIVCTEFLIVVKFDYNTITKPLPGPIALFWSFGIVILVIYTIWNFNLLPNMSTRPEDVLTLDKEMRKLALLMPPEKQRNLDGIVYGNRSFANLGNAFQSTRKSKSDTSTLKKSN